MSNYTEENIKKTSGIAVFFSIFLSVILVILFLGVNSVLLLKMTCNDFFGDDKNPGILRNIDLKSIPIGEFVQSMKLEGVSIEPDSELGDIIFSVFQNAGIQVSSKEQVDAMLDAINAERFLNEVKQEYLAAFMGEREYAYITADQLRDFILSNREAIGVAMGNGFTDTDMAKIEYFISMNDIENQTRLELPEEYQNVVHYVKMFLSNTICIILGVCILLLAVLLFACNWKYKYMGAFYAGISFLATGGAAAWASGVLEKLVFHFIKIESSLVNFLIEETSNLILKNATLFLIIGGVLFGVFLGWAIIAGKRRKTAN